ncbi:MAG TPA: hypothetical protein VFX51_17790 [Solirubrobacteraceae bacterium]|nr:hypothetical protein [Solirubrobacteraceae bacterium]
MLRGTPLKPPLSTWGVEDRATTVGAMVGDLRPRAAFAAMAAQGHLKN